MRRRLGHHRQPGKQGGGGGKGLLAKLSIAVFVLLICTLSLLFSVSFTPITNGSTAPTKEQISVEELWKSANSGGWRPSSAPRSEWPSPPKETNGYLRVRCNGGLNQQRSAICNAVLAARIMNATLVLPELDANSFWHDDSGFHGLYDVEHFIQSLRFDVQIVERIPEIHKNGKTKKIKAFQLRPPRDAPISWYTTDALKKMKEHGAIYLTPFSHRLAEEIDNPEYQRSLHGNTPALLRWTCCHLLGALTYLPLQNKKNIEKKRLVLSYVLWSFDNSTRIYLAAGELFGGERFMKPFRALFPRLENHSTVDASEELATNSRGLIGSAVDYMVCLLADIFMPTYDGPSNFANNLLGHRLYYGFRTNIRPDRKGLAPVFIARENGRTAGFEEAVRHVMLKTNFGGPHKRISPESFYTNSWPECFCQMETQNPAHKCPENVMQNLHSQLESENMGLEQYNRSDSRVSSAER
ncbi:hypothetical protein OIU78_025879 [Salix suchowensis]|nr:hypothetical protein OIU78_025879 [Salix suchowensis]